MKLFRIINGQAQEYNNVITDAFFVVVSATEGGEVSGGGLYDTGASVTVTTEGQELYSFKGWYRDGVKASGSKNYTFTVTEDTRLEARYEYIGVNVNILTEGEGQAEGSGTYERGEIVTLTASPDEGYKFGGWYINGEKVGEYTTYTFTAQNDITVGAFFASALLPEEYQQVEYIQSDGNSYIDTYIKPNIDTSIIAKVRITSANRYTAWFGCISTSKSNLRGFTGDGTNMNYTFNNAEISLTQNNTAAVYEFELTKTHVKNQYDTKEWNPPDETSGMNLFLFALNYGGQALSMSNNAIMYEFNIYDGSQHVRRLVPCFRKRDGKAGMYDTISGSFFPNKGTGEFIVGPNV